MKSPDFRAAIVDYIREQAKPVDKFSHQERLYALTKEVGAEQSYDDDVVFAAAWMHDLGVFIGHRPEDLAALAKWDMIALRGRESSGAAPAIWISRTKNSGGD
ncbi:MAG: hypothetical protein WDM76_17610 [Limisphaerales bacterium]